MEVCISHEADGVSKSPHFQGAMFAHSAEQNDLIHKTACRAKQQKG